MELDGSTCSDRLPVVTGDFELDQGTGVRRGVLGGCLRAPESTRNDPQPEEQKMSMPQKSTFIHKLIIILICTYL